MKCSLSSRSFEQSVQTEPIYYHHPNKDGANKLNKYLALCECRTLLHEHVDFFKFVHTTLVFFFSHV